ncbi:squamosa promoter-binding-like protein 6 [Cornus florida]|uniref:squamosa promoter-binding-like protein 6 n=1 Tax=Cornus florida TaxID=4283 RepID=UPI0028A0605C|nr:squamosa promoter-binding-like protein 6 [Cornus florida]
MESWSYVSEGKGFVYDEAISGTDAILRGKKQFMDWELKTPCSYGSNIVVSGQEGIENQGFVKMGFSKMRRKSLPNHSIGDVWSGSGGGRMVNPIGSTPNAFSGEEESNLKLPSSVMESNSRDSSLIDLKLGRFADHKDAHVLDFVKTTAMVSASESSMPGKRARAIGLSSHTPICQVQGCKKDLPNN